PPREHGRFSRSQRQRLVVSIRAQRLRSAKHPGQRLNRHANYIVQRLLSSQGNTGRLGMEAQRPRTRVLCAEPLGHHRVPDSPRRSILGYLLEEVVMSMEAKAQPGVEIVNI